MNKIIAKKYYRIEFEVLSPLSVGSGINGETDSDILVDSKGNAYISGSSLAGVYRSVLEKQEAEDAFGKLLVGTNEIDESLTITYDAVLKDTKSDKVYIGKRDMVALDEFKVAKEGAKFDFQILEPGVIMVTYIESNLIEDKGVNNAVDKVLNVWKTNGISFGSKTRRGYGLTKAKKIQEADFDFNNADRTAAWINFDLYNENDTNWADYKNEVSSSTKYVEVKLELQLLGGLSIREYSTKVGQADYEQMKLHNCDSTAVIPGTSWAGAFRSQMKKLGMTEDDLKKVFGDVKRDKGHQSLIYFSESYITDGVDIVYSRNAVDRFSGGTVDGALYTESTRYNGTTELAIRIDKTCVDKVCAYLAAAIMDLHNGYLAVGGLTAIGRGLFEVISVNVNGVKTEINYDKIREALK